MKIKTIAAAIGVSLAIPVGGIIMGGKLLENMIISAMARDGERYSDRDGESDSARDGERDSGSKCLKVENKIENFCSYDSDSGQDSGSDSDSGMNDSDRIEDEIKSKEKEHCYQKCGGDFNCEKFCEKETSSGDSSHEIISKEETELKCKLDKLTKEKIEYDSDEAGHDDSGKSDSDLEKECADTGSDVEGECEVDSGAVGQCVERCRNDLGNEKECKELCKEVKRTECTEAKKRKKKLECKIEKKKEELHAKACEQQCKVLLCNDKCKDNSECREDCENDSEIKRFCKAVECPEIAKDCEPSVPRKRSFKDNHYSLQEDANNIESTISRLEDHLQNLENVVPEEKKGKVANLQSDRDAIAVSIQNLKEKIENLGDHVDDTILDNQIIADLKAAADDLNEKIKQLRDDAVAFKEDLQGFEEFQDVINDIQDLRRESRNTIIDVDITDNDNKENKKLLEENPNCANYGTAGFCLNTPPGGSNAPDKWRGWQQLLRP